MHRPRCSTNPPKTFRSSSPMARAGSTAIRVTVSPVPRSPKPPNPQKSLNPPNHTDLSLHLPPAGLPDDQLHRQQQRLFRHPLPPAEPQPHLHPPPPPPRPPHPG